MSNVTAVERLINCICKRLCTEEDNTADELANKSDILAAALYSFGSRNCKGATMEEVNVLKIMLLQQIPHGEKDTACLKIDYGPEHCDMVNVILKWNELISKQREDANEPCLPMSLGLGLKVNYETHKGAAWFEAQIIDDDGSILETDPWEDYYKESTPELLERAKHLRPVASDEMQNKLFNRSICQGLTLEKDGPKLMRSDNPGLVRFLISEASSSDVDFSARWILKDIAQVAVRKGYWRVVIDLLEKGMPLYEKGEDFFMLDRYTSYNNPFLELIQSTEYAADYPRSCNKRPVIPSNDGNALPKEFFKVLVEASVAHVIEDGSLSGKIRQLQVYFEWNEETREQFWSLFKEMYASKVEEYQKSQELQREWTMKRLKME